MKAMAPGNAPDKAPGSSPLLEVRDLRVNFATYGGTVNNGYLLSENGLP